MFMLIASLLLALAVTYLLARRYSDYLERHRFEWFELRDAVYGLSERFVAAWGLLLAWSWTIVQAFASRVRCRVSTMLFQVVQLVRSQYARFGRLSSEWPVRRKSMFLAEQFGLRRAGEV